MGKGSRTGTGGSSVGSGGHFVHKSLWYLLYDNLRVAGHPEAYGTTLSLIPLGRTLSEHSGPPSPPWSWPHWGSSRLRWALQVLLLSELLAFLLCSGQTE